MKIEGKINGLTQAEILKRKEKVKLILLMIKIPKLIGK